METDPLQQLRGVHLPPDPAWWPPAFGWWLVALLIIAAIGWVIYRAIATYQARAPSRAARARLIELHLAQEAGSISAQEYLHLGNETLKRLLVRAYGRSEYAHMSGDEWLNALDQVSNSQAFSAGPGKVLGNERFSPAPHIDVDALNEQLTYLVRKVAP